ncbi:tetratricopeptide repeat protein [Phormidium tenue FACHB-886]|nr:tetratricopeptide repeat protein [Phormidium tenue FACHB-886]
MGGRYKLLEQLGAGGFGQTFLAEDLHLPGHPRCVLKRLQPQSQGEQNLALAKRLFNTEAEVLYQLGNHDQIPRLFAHFEHEGEFYLAQELVVGHPLLEEMIAERPWTEAQVVALLQDVLGVLSFVHQQNVIHRDIKPANLIRRDRDGKISLIDFGAVKQVSAQLTQSGSGITGIQTVAIGTPGYMPNEQVAGIPCFSSDVYAVGILAIQALTGKSPRLLRQSSTTGEIQWQHYSPQTDVALAVVLDKMTRYDFRARYPNAAVALTAVQSLSIASATPLPVEPVQTPASTHSVETFEILPNSTAPLPLSAQQTVPWEEQAAQTPSNSASTNSALPQSNSWTTTKHLFKLDRHFPTRSFFTEVPVRWRVNLLQLSQLGSSKIALSVAGIMLLGGWVVLIQPSPSPQSTRLPSANPPHSNSSTNPNPLTDSNLQFAKLLADANQLRERQQFQQASTLYKRAIALHKESAEAYWGHCYSLNALEEFAAAIAACNTALKLKPKYPEALWSKGYALDRQQQDQQALELYEQAIALKPNFAEAWSNKGTTLLQLNQPAEAISAFDQATRLKPNFAEAWNNRAAALWRLQRFDEAIVSVDRAIQIQPNYQDALSLRQQMRQQLGLE